MARWDPFKSSIGLSSFAKWNVRTSKGPSGSGSNQYVIFNSVLPYWVRNGDLRRTWSPLVGRGGCGSAHMFYCAVKHLANHNGYASSAWRNRNIPFN